MARVMSARRYRWLLNLYPPLLFQRVRIAEIGPEFLFCRVRVRKSLLNRNHLGNLFGGTIFCGFDPMYAILYEQALARRGVDVVTVLKAAEIEYLKPGRSDLLIDHTLTEADIDAAQELLERDGRGVREHFAEAVDRDGVVCARARSLVHLRLSRRS